MITEDDVKPGAAYVFDYYGSVEVAIIVSFSQPHYVNVYYTFRQQFHSIRIDAIVDGENKSCKNLNHKWDDGNYGFIKNED